MSPFAQVQTPPRSIVERHQTEVAALEHLWPHSDDLEWDEFAEWGMRVFASGHMSTVIDVQGRSYLDALAGLFLVNVGHGRDEIGRAMAAQASRLAYTASSNTANVANVGLAETIASITPGDLNRLFFCSGGSEAVETAVKIARQAQVLRGYPKRYKIICRHGSYHGQTFGAMSLTASASERFFGPFMHGVVKVPSPNRYRTGFGLEDEAGDLACARAVEQEIIAQGAEYVAAVIAEPVSVSNGTHIPSNEYWQELRRICDRHGVLLVLDEVITGYGRTGTMFAAEQFGIVPDLMTMAKGLSSGYAPIAAVAVRPGVFEPFTEHGNALNHLLTFGGNAVACAAASKNIEILQREQLDARSRELGLRLYDRARALLEHPSVGDVRGGMGLLCGVELVRNQENRESFGRDHPFIKELGRRLQERGVITRVWDVLHLAPPLVVTEDEMDRMLDTIDDCLTQLEREFAPEID